MIGNCSENITVLLVNLQRDKDRLQNSLSVWRDFNVHRIDAMSGASISYSPLFTSEDKLSISNHNNLSSGELGCAYSHLVSWIKALKIMEEQKLDSIVIAEDDCAMFDSESVKKAIVDFNNIPTADLLYLGYNMNRRRVPIITLIKSKLRLFLYDHLLPNQFVSAAYAATRTNAARKKLDKNFSCAAFTYGTYAYVIKKNAARQLVETNAFLSFRSDEAIDHAVVMKRICAIRTSSPMIEVNKDFISNIRNTFGGKACK